MDKKTDLKDKSVRDFITGATDPATLLKPTFVKAGAGAGKTTSIKHRVLNLILHHDITPKEMVIITYTVKGAEELATRIREVIESELKEPETSDINRKKLNQALGELSLARISTVHSFCHDLLLEYPIEFLVDPSAQILDGRGSKALNGSCQNEFLKHSFLREGEHYEKYKTAFEAFEQLIAFDDDHKKIFEVFQLLYNNRDMTPKQVNFDFVGRGAVELAIMENFEALISKFGEMDGVCKDKECKLYQAKDGYLKYSTNIKVIQDLFKFPYKGTLFSLREGNATNWPKPWFAEFKEIRKSFRDDFDKYQLLANAELYKYLVTAFEGYSNLVDDYKKENGVIDFFDCLLLVKKGLQENEFLRRTIQKKFNVFIIDEFQDSDPIQSEIATLLSCDRPSKLMFVGDGKQAIYGFARANIEVFRAMEKHVVDEFKGESKELSTNFRSQHNVLDFINTEFQNILQADYSQMHVSPEKKTNQGLIESINLKTKLPSDLEAPNANERRARESFMICSKIKNMIEKDGYRPEDFLLLFRKSTPMDHYETTLSKMGIPVQNSKSKDYLKKEQALEILAVMGYFLFPKDKYFEFSVKHASFCAGALPDCLFEIAKSQASIKTRTREAIKQLGLSHASKVLSDATYLEVAEYLLEIFDMEVSLAKGNYSQAFLHMLQRAQQEGFNYDKESDERVYYEKLKPDSVRLMTIHASKGLEAKVVFVIAHDSLDNQKANVCIDRAKREVYPRNPFISDKTLESYTLDDLNALLQRQDDKRLEEEKRVLYVGCTRAQEELYLVYNEDVELSLFMEPLEKAIVGNKKKSSLDFGDYKAEAEKLNAGGVVEGRGSAEIKFSREAFGDISKLKVGTPAVTKLIAKPELFRSSKGKGMEFGSFAHKVMEVVCWDLFKGSARDLDQLFKNVCEVMDYELGVKDGMDLKGAITRFRSSEIGKTVANAKSILSEINFCLPREFHGIIDLVVERKDGSIGVIDFKTDVLEGSELRKEVEEHYKEQIGAYVNAMKKTSGNDVEGECCYLFA